jgi:hypothetical protein
MTAVRPAQGLGVVLVTPRVNSTIKFIVPVLFTQGFQLQENYCYNLTISFTQLWQSHLRGILRFLGRTKIRLERSFTLFLQQPLP